MEGYSTISVEEGQKLLIQLVELAEHSKLNRGVRVWGFQCFRLSTTHTIPHVNKIQCFHLKSFQKYTIFQFRPLSGDNVVVK